MAINVTWLQNGGYTAPQDRTEQTAMLTKSAVVSVRAGIVPSDGTDATVTAQGTPNMTVNVSPFQAIIPDANGRAYVYTSDSSVVSPTFATASGSHPRIDLVIARVYDNAAGDSAATTSLTLPGSAGSITVQSVTGTVELVTGTPAASPTAPALPNSRCIILAVVTVPTSASSIVTGDIAASGGGATAAPFTVAAGGVVPVLNLAAAPATPYEGMQIWTMDTNLLWAYVTGTGWVVQSPRMSLSSATPLAQSSTGTLGVTNPLVVTAVPYPSIHDIVFGSLITQVTGADVSDLTLFVNSTSTRVYRGTGIEFDGAGGLKIAVAANASNTYQTEITRVTGSSNWTSVADTRFNYIDVTVHPA